MPDELDLPPIHPDSIGVASAHINPDIPHPEWEWANELVQKLSRRSPMRTLITGILAGQQQRLPMEFLQSVLHDKSPKKWRERALAAWALGSIPLEKDHVHGATLVLSEILGGKIAHDRFGMGCSRSYLTAFGILMVTSLTSMLFRQTFREGFSPIALIMSFVGSLFISLFGGLPLSLAISPIVIPASMSRDKKRLNFIRTASARALGKLRTPHAVAALAEAARDGDKAVHDNSLQSLRIHLPHLTEQHYGTLSGATVPALCFLLNQKNKQLRLELVVALEKVGDGRALGPVARLHSITRDEEVKEAAGRAMTVLARRAENEKSAATLLRATGAPGEESGILLRPAGASTEHDEAQLLRAVLADGEE